MVYEWKPGSRLNRYDANVVGHVLEEIHAKWGAITPEAVVDAARPPESPLHDMFEWDDSVAAELYRRTQATHILRSIVVRDVTPQQQPIRAFVVVKPAGDEEDHKQVYLPIVTAFRDPNYRAQILDRALRELEAWVSRYRMLSELAEVFAAADKLLQARREAQSSEVEESEERVAVVVA